MILTFVKDAFSFNLCKVKRRFFLIRISLPLGKKMQISMLQYQLNREMSGFSYYIGIL